MTEGRKTVKWTCPVCGRVFANANQWHSCGRYDLDDHFFGKPPEFVAMYHEIEKTVTSFGSFLVDPAKTAILFKRRVTFTAIRLRKSYVRLGIRLEREIDDPRVESVFPMSPGLVEVRFRLTTLAEIDATMKKWLREAWKAAK